MTFDLNHLQSLDASLSREYYYQVRLRLKYAFSKESNLRVTEKNQEWPHLTPKWPLTSHNSTPLMTPTQRLLSPGWVGIGILQAEIWSLTLNMVCHTHTHKHTYFALLSVPSSYAGGPQKLYRHGRRQLSNMNRPNLLYCLGVVFYGLGCNFWNSIFVNIMNHCNWTQWSVML